MFPDTPKTLLVKIAASSQGDDRAEWEVFVETYTSPLRHFVRSVDSRLSDADVEDVVQDVFVRLVDVLRDGKIDRAKGKFRAYLASMARRLLIDRYRAALVRPVLSGDDAATADSSVASDSVDHADPGVLFDVRWRMAAHAAAVEHVMTRLAVSEQSKAIYRALTGDDLSAGGLTPREIAVRFGVSYEVVKQVKSRMDRAVAALERPLVE